MRSSIKINMPRIASVYERTMFVMSVIAAAVGLILDVGPMVLIGGVFGCTSLGMIIKAWYADRLIDSFSEALAWEVEEQIDEFLSNKLERKKG